MKQDRPPLAYKNEVFLESADARPLRMVSEYLEPLSHFRRQNIRDTVVFFGSARIREDGPLARYYRDARELARLVTEWSKQFTQESWRFVVPPEAAPASWRRPIEGRRMRVEKPWASILGCLPSSCPIRSSPTS